MSQPAISVRGLGKQYRLGRRERYRTLRDTIADTVRGAFSSRVAEDRGDRTFWALEDVSFDAAQGETIGIIGRNGAGKSTLLKVISRITEPTRGEVRINGRIASLLEVGTGFHPELTGRENIFLNGAILGMRKAEILARFDEIVAFAEIDRFIDTPVKHYSSGMYVRLAFAVAAHLEPEILVIDEVLAVGDAAFQAKCLGRIGEVARDGRTVLFVSHNMAAVNRLCSRSILLESGRVVADGDAPEISARYMGSGSGTTAIREWHDPSTRPGDDVARLLAVKVMQNGQAAETVDIRFPVEVALTYEVFVKDADLSPVFTFFDQHGTVLFTSGELSDALWLGVRGPGVLTSTCIIPGNVFAEGLVRVYAEVCTRRPFYSINCQEYDCVAFQVVDLGEAGSVRSGWARHIAGVMRPLCEWRLDKDVRGPETAAREG